MSILNLLDRPIAFNRTFVDLGVGITGALMLSQCVYWSTRTQRGDGWFYKTQAEWSDETGLSRREQETARKRLVARGYLDEDRRGVPCKTYYRLNKDALERDILDLAQMRQSSMAESDKLECTNAPYSDGGKRQTITETTTETTPEITDNPASATALHEGFELFYNAGLPKKNRKKAESAFRARAKKHGDPKSFANMLANNIASRLGTGELGFDAMHPTTYLNQQRWEDELPEHCPHATIVEAWNAELPPHIEKVSTDDWTPESKGFQTLAAAWENFKTRPRASTGKPVFTEESEGVEFYREVFRRLAKVDRIQSEDAARWCRLSWAAQQQVTVQIFKGEIA